MQILKQLQEAFKLKSSVMTVGWMTALGQLPQKRGEPKACPQAMCTTAAATREESPRPVLKPCVPQQLPQERRAQGLSSSHVYHSSCHKRGEPQACPQAMCTTAAATREESPRPVLKPCVPQQLPQKRRAQGPSSRHVYQTISPKISTDFPVSNAWENIRSLTFVKFKK